MKFLLSLKNFSCRFLHPYFIALPSRTMTHVPKVFVTYTDADDKMKINFTSAFPELPNRCFTFMRAKEETLEVTLSRMKLKVIEALTKTSRKKRNKKSSEDINDVIPAPSISISLSKEGESVSFELKNIDAWTENTQVKINDYVYDIVENPPAVEHLSLPKSIMSGFPVYPRIELQFCSKEQCEFNWYRTCTQLEKRDPDFDRSVLKKVNSDYWLLLSSGFFLITSDSDVGCKLRVTCLPKSGDKIGLEEETVSSTIVQYGPGKCPFEKRHEFTKELTSPGSFRYISYNILADLYADSDTARNVLFPYCPSEFLALDYRKQLYLKEIIGYNADIICLQEVDRKVFLCDLIPVLSSTGLEGIYNEKGGKVVEGLACFYRSSKFKVVETHGLILSDALQKESVLQPIFSKICENEKLKERVMNRTTALQVVLLESLEVPHKRVLVGNTHLYFHPESDNIRLLQATSCIMYLESVLQRYIKENPEYSTSLILSGDFNSCPEFGVYELMTKGHLNEDNADWKSNPEETVPGSTLSHSLSLASACGTPAYTNFTEEFVGCLDYIFYDQSQLEVDSVVPFPSHEDVAELTALPNRLFPSDHIALACTLKWK